MEPMNTNWSYLDTIGPSIRATVKKITYGTTTLDVLAAQLEQYAANIRREITKRNNAQAQEPLSREWNAE